MHHDDIDGRLAAATIRFRALGADLRSAGPWPLAERIDDTPEASWGPHEVLAHMEEMLSFWLGETERILEASEPEPFGRVGTDALRIGIIDRDRKLPLRELEARVVAGIGRWRERWPELTDAERARTGIHPRLGEMTVAQIADRFVATHVEDHNDQLAACLESDAAPA